VRTVFNPRNLRVAQPYRIGRTLDGLFREFRYDIDADRVLRVFFKKDVAAGAPELDVEVVSLPKESAIAAVSAEMNRYAYTGHAAAALNWLETLWPGNDAVKLKMLNTLRTAWSKSVFAEDLKGLAADYR